MDKPLVLQMVRALAEDMSAMKADLSELSQRMTTVEASLRHLAEIEALHHANLCSRLDRLIGRMERIDHCLEMA